MQQEKRSELTALAVGRSRLITILRGVARETAGRSPAVCFNFQGRLEGRARAAASIFVRTRSRVSCSAYVRGSCDYVAGMPPSTALSKFALNARKERVPCGNARRMGRHCRPPTFIIWTRVQHDSWKPEDPLIMGLKFL